MPCANMLHVANVTSALASCMCFILRSWALIVECCRRAQAGQTELLPYPSQFCLRPLQSVATLVLFITVLLLLNASNFSELLIHSSAGIHRSPFDFGTVSTLLNLVWNRCTKEFQAPCLILSFVLQIADTVTEPKLSSGNAVFVSALFRLACRMEVHTPVSFHQLCCRLRTPSQS